MLNFRHGRFICSLLALWALFGCNAPTSTNQVGENVDSETETVDLPLVVTTTDVICDLTRQIAQETIDLNCLVDAGIDPHVYQATPDDRREMDQADLILYGGYGFEPSLVSLIEATANEAPKVAVYEQAVPEPIMMRGDDGHDHGHDHSHGDEEEFADPHVWHDGSNGIEIVNVIAEQLAQLQPDQAQLYQDQANLINDELGAIDEWIKAQIETIPPNQRILVSNHGSLGYFVSAYGLQSNSALQGVSTEEAPTAGRVGDLVRKIQDSNVPTIFVESSVSRTIINTVATEANVKVADNPLFADGLGESGSGAETYQKKLMLNTQTIVEGLGGSFSPFQ
ncbi:zinc ABC transporter substrate-binding protein [Cyanobacterium stanieri LEGE 03274]|uniref:Zinc ABC transporter substrate-binding protein n=1 Tax=Cyanobacterium stanieri LEGE 03274 TaxID=1828756 RepID=A0ABR9V8I1_9CHRO|nr:zinc ABC transporter substrate-binding protein [Cyanobacterium stanieri]MBE9223446.1 zinc ABC transporter substrate-binding protein [Cyanobacterium stanieri LEGE 03274]